MRLRICYHAGVTLDQKAAREPLSKAHFLLVGLSLAALAVLVSLRFLVQPDPRGLGTHEQLGLAPCPLHAWTGFPCPTCGVTTAVALTTHARLVQAARTQPLGVVLALGAPLFALWAGIQHLCGRDTAEILRRARPWRLWPFALAFVLCAWIFKLMQMRS